MSQFDANNAHDIAFCDHLGNDSSGPLKIPRRCVVVLWAPADGDWGSGTYQLEISPDGGTTWIAYPDATWTDDAAKEVDFGRDALYRITGSGGTDNAINGVAIPLQVPE